jgi:hypothetical protein
MVSVAAGSGMYKLAQGGEPLRALNSCNSFCSLRFSSVRFSQYLFSISQSTSVCFSLVLQRISSMNKINADIQFDTAPRRISSSPFLVQLRS